jgi:prepilin-type processing-associated H-X9-DG protein
LPSQIFAKSTGGVPNGAEIFQPADLICPALARMDNTGPFAYYVNNSGVTFNSTKTIPSLMPWPASKVALFMDGGRGNRNNRTFPLTQAQSDYIKPSNPAVLGFPHSNNPATCYKAPSTGGKMNVVFLDGHIQMMDRDIGPFDNNFWCSEKAIK